MSPEPSLTAVVCTRNREAQLVETLAALAGQPGLPVLVVDQGDAPGAFAVDPGVTVLPDAGRGLSRARNLALRHLTTDWLVFVDDDCLVTPTFAADLRGVLGRHPEAVLVAPDVTGPVDPRMDGLLVSVFGVEHEAVHRGPRVAPADVGFGVCFAVRRDWAVRLDGWDERLGAGTQPFPAAEDMDFNHRLLRAGGVAVTTPAVRVHHAQWRSPDEVVALLGGYAVASAGACCKLLRTGDARSGARLWLREAHAAVRMLASGVRRRSRLRLRVGGARLVGHARGTILGLRVSW